ncbi:PHP domain-containing protein [Chrysiogenes arsenatis]|uniref:PHP domain-containing protein n=1 Tax=Chrysiogenes arsenatis TaxID=309797 RepID=UPI0004036370|nr:PHP domain-containing protein [Chrysiogenes arsenatis]
MIDLHTHSTASDGTLTPSELVAQAAANSLEAVALTDHDTVSGVAEFLTACEHHAIEGVAGIEISAHFKSRSLHLLGYYIDHQSNALSIQTTDLVEARDERNLQMIKKLNALGFDITLEEVQQVAGDVVGRPHMAQILQTKGYVRSHQEAFGLYLGATGKAYVPKERLTPEEAIELILAAGGLPVVAHPGTLPLRGERDFRKLLQHLKSKGLAGVEVYYPEHTLEERFMLASLADQLGLVATGGSDFHGGNRPGVVLGRGDGSLDIPYRVLEELQALRGK